MAKVGIGSSKRGAKNLDKLLAGLSHWHSSASSGSLKAAGGGGALAKALV